tara:strand:- start:6434 stop:6556 length:123 start_codon:yes stop_codon:yes gene_type:complete
MHFSISYINKRGFKHLDMFEVGKKSAVNLIKNTNAIEVIA